MLSFQKILNATVRSWRTGAARRRSSKTHTGQELETRRVPVVTATLAAGVLTLTADNNVNDIDVNGDVLDGTVDLVGNAGTQFLVNGVLVNNFTFEDVATLKITMGNGSDIVGLDNLILNQLQVNMGEGNNRLDMDNLFANATTLTTGNGNNTIDGDVLRLGATTITTGNGNDVIDLDELRVVGALTIKTNAGDDDVLLDDGGVARGLRVLGALKIETGEGGDDVNLGSSGTATFGSLTIDTANRSDDVRNIAGRVMGALTVKTGEGVDDIDTDAGLVAGAVTLDLGNGGGSIDVDDLSATSMTVISGSGAAVINVDDITVVGATSIKTGEGDDQLSLRGDIDLAGLTIDVGNGSNVVDFEDTVNANSLTLTSGSGIDTITIDVATRGDVNIKTGEGNDILQLTAAILGKLTIDMAGGTDFFEAEELLSVRGATSIKTGSGNDDVSIQGFAAAVVNQFGSTLLIDMGKNDSDNLALRQVRVVGDTTLIAEDLDIDDARFKGKFKATVEGGTSASVDVERDTTKLGATTFEKDAEFFVNAVTSDDIDIGIDNAASRTVFNAAAKFKGLSADPIEVNFELIPNVRVFFNGPAPLFTNAIRFDV